ncbi:conserved hypothetical protein [Candidatus Accumulibacter aalborgensis]|uniref:Lanthionine synthetase C family protein n=1 Tax=Candidatus Accumulibacter aalborgensis TaxID=1860102 RepID=A0A1A8XZU1_9PROT|nr:lanthionine synthetase C family protein [Candidatus Accumulibacter aalborgensis]SBT10231.1 conserved hypothetical protein [Candidatus Accumulibacter aalborgensis]
MAINRRVFQGWSPGLDQALRTGCEFALRGIVEALPLPGDASSSASVAGGESGYAVFFAYLSISSLDERDSDRYATRALAHLQAAVDGLSGLAQRPDLFGGFTGIAWAASQLQRCLLLTDDDFGASVDAALEQWLARHGEEMLGDLVGGLAGIGAYGIARRQWPAGRRIVALAVEALGRSAIVHQNHRTWFSSADGFLYASSNSRPEGCFNLGLSHGVPGVVAFLAKAAALGVPGAAALANDAGEWLLMQQRDYANGSRFAYHFHDAPVEQSDGSRLAWCYGDLGIAAAMLRAARHLRRSDWEEAARALGRRAAGRHLADSGVVDAGVCHGAFGNAHLFNRLRAATGESCFLAAANRWVNEGLAMRREGEGLAGFSAWLPVSSDDPPTDSWQPLAGMLEGASGIGLVLLGFLYPVEPAWDELLSVDIPVVT